MQYFMMSLNMFYYLCWITSNIHNQWGVDSKENVQLIGTDGH